MISLAPETTARLFSPIDAFASPITVGILSGIVLTFIISRGLIFSGSRQGRLAPETQQELKARWQSWVWLVAAIVVPILLGAAYTVIAVSCLSLLCYREYARTVGLFRHPIISLIVVVGVASLALASLDHFDRLYFALSSFGVGLIVVVSVLTDRPQGFIQRVALGVFGFLLFGFSLGYLGLMTNATYFRPLLLTIILAVEANDIFAYCCGKLIGGPKLIPNTSPGKTISGSVGAAILTSLLVALLFHQLFYQTAIDHWWILILLGLLISIIGQLGDLTLSSIKRDLGIKDFAKTLPGHGGWLDRFDSLVLVPPVVYHFLSLFLGPLGADQPLRVFTGG